MSDECWRVTCPRIIECRHDVPCERPELQFCPYIDDDARDLVLRQARELAEEAKP